TFRHLWRISNCDWFATSKNSGCSSSMSYLKHELFCSIELSPLKPQLGSLRRVWRRWRICLRRWVRRLRPSVEKHHVEWSGSRQEYRSRSRSAIVILDPDDIVLAEIAAGLDLNQLQVDLARILEAMLRSDRDVD